MGNLLSRAHRKIFGNPTGDLADTAQSKGNLAGGYCLFFFFFSSLVCIEQRSPEPVKMKQEAVGSDIFVIFNWSWNQRGSEDFREYFC